MSDCVLPNLYPITPLMRAILALSVPNTVTHVPYEHSYYPDYDPRTKLQDLTESEGMTVRVVLFE